MTPSSVASAETEGTQGCDVHSGNTVEKWIRVECIVRNMDFQAL